MTAKRGWGANELPESSEAREQYGSTPSKPMSRRAALLMALSLTGFVALLGAHDEIYGGVAMLIIVLFFSLCSRSGNNGPLPQ